MNYLNKGIAQVKTLEVERNCNEGIAKMVSSLEQCGSSREIRLFCNTHIWVSRSNLIVAFYSPKVNKFNVGAILFLRPFNIIFDSCGVGWSVDEVQPSRLFLIGTYLDGQQVGMAGEQPTWFIAIPWSVVIDVIVLLKI